jgi:secretion/DNA translocation related CpaE-like protein
LVDADRYGGGIDLLVGAERVDGWRWPRLARASGHLGDLGGQLPTVDGIDVLAMARTGHPLGWELPADPLRAVLGSARRGYELTVVDLPRGAGPAVKEVLLLADLMVLMLRDDLRGVAAGREMLAVIEESPSEVGLVLRQSRPRLLDASVVAEGLGLRLLGTLADDSALVLAAERGDPPGRSVRSPLAELCRELLREVTAQPSAETLRLQA